MNGIDPTGHFVQDYFKASRSKLGLFKLAASAYCVFWGGWIAENSGGESGSSCTATAAEIARCATVRHQSSGGSDNSSGGGGGGRGGGRGGSGSGSGSGTQKIHPGPTKPTKPRIDTNAHNGPNPKPAPNLPPAAVPRASGRADGHLATDHALIQQLRCDH
ncbi:hypothetical protein [Streptomyces goshikiensis]|uniref:hypothetical protein n=1 Tax=Streptomyces goshikiensis TaxID=1942 RepID=UPI00364CCD1C